MTNPLSGKSQDFAPLATDQTHSLHDPTGTPSDRKAAWQDIMQNAHGLGNGLWKTTAGVLVLATAGTDYLTAASSNTLTNKTLDSAGTGNAVKVNGTALTAVTGTGSVVLATSPTLVTPTLGAATATTVNGTTIPSSGTLARTDVGNTFTGHQTMEGVTATGATGTGNHVYSASPSIVTPTIASHVNANHDHTNSAGGGQLSATSVFSAGTVPTARLGSGTADVAHALRGDQTWGKTSQLVYAETANVTVSSNNGTLTTLITTAPTVTANSLAIGDAFLIDMGINFASQGSTSTATIAVLFGGTTLFTVTTPSMTAGTNLRRMHLSGQIFFAAIGASSTIITSLTLLASGDTAANSATAQPLVAANSSVGTFQTTTGPATTSSNVLDIQGSLSNNAALILVASRGLVIQKVSA